MPGCLLAPCTATRLAQGLIHVAFRGLQQPFLRAYLSAEREQLLRPSSSPRWLWSSTAVRTSRCLPVSVGAALGLRPYPAPCWEPTGSGSLRPAPAWIMMVSAYTIGAGCG